MYDIEKLMKQIEEAREAVNRALEQESSEAVFAKNRELDRLLEQYVDARRAMEKKG